MNFDEYGEFFSPKYVYNDERESLETDKVLTLLSRTEILGYVDHIGIDSRSKLDVLKKYGSSCSITDLAILTGAFYDEKCLVNDENYLKGRTGLIFTKTCLKDKVDTVTGSDRLSKCDVFDRNCTIRPVLVLLNLDSFDLICQKKITGYNDTYEVEYGEYPQYVPEYRLQRILERKFKRINKDNELQLTGKDYTFDETAITSHETEFQPVTYKEYEYQGRKFIRVKANSCYEKKKFKLSDGKKYKNGDYVWVEVLPVKWLIDYESKKLISKRGLLSGIRFDNYRYASYSKYLKTSMYEYLNSYMIKNLFQGYSLDMPLEEVKEEIIVRNNPLDDKSPLEVLNIIETLEIKTLKNLDIDSFITFGSELNPYLDYISNSFSNLVFDNKEIDEKIEWIKQNINEFISDNEKLNSDNLNEINNANIFVIDYLSNQIKVIDALRKIVEAYIGKLENMNNQIQQYETSVSNKNVIASSNNLVVNKMINELKNEFLSRQTLLINQYTQMSLILANSVSNLTLFKKVKNSFFPSIIINLNSNDKSELVTRNKILKEFYILLNSNKKNEKSEIEIRNRRK